ncbi:MAG: hypothetical protein FMNOHCHN_00954 [Ignavibacteriaceae bacterium]|nr:hypothetical protein [Ignavibacteriaceae bacterium]
MNAFSIVAILSTAYNFPIFPNDPIRFHVFKIPTLLTLLLPSPKSVPETIPELVPERSRGGAEGKSRRSRVEPVTKIKNPSLGGVLKSLFRIFFFIALFLVCRAAAFFL